MHAWAVFCRAFIAVGVVDRYRERERESMTRDGSDAGRQWGAVGCSVYVHFVGSM